MAETRLTPRFLDVVSSWTVGDVGHSHFFGFRISDFVIRISRIWLSYYCAIPCCSRGSPGELLRLDRLEQQLVGGYQPLADLWLGIGHQAHHRAGGSVTDMLE